MKKLKLSKLTQSNYEDDKIESCLSCPFLEVDEYDSHFCYLNVDISDVLAYNSELKLSKNCPLPEAENEV